LIKALFQHRRAMGRGFWSLCDQGIVSSGNFLSNIFLARAVSEYDYGTFALLFMILLALNNVHASLITYQISVRASTCDHSTARKFIGSGLLATILLSLLLAIPLAIACLAVGQPRLIPLAIPAMLLWQLQETVRRGLMARLRFAEACIGDALSFLGQAAIIFYLAHHGKATIANVFIAMAATSLVAMLVQILQLGFVQITTALIPEFARNGWSMGRWLLMNNLLSVLNLQAIGWIIATFHGREQVAQIQAISNILGMTHPVLMGLSALIVPATAKARANGGTRHGARVAFTYAAMGAAMLIPIYLVIALIPHDVLYAFYKNKYIDCTGLLRIIALVYSIDFIGQMMGAMLSGLEQTRSVFLASLCMGVVTVLFTVPLAIKFGILGALIGACLSVTTRMLASAYFTRSLLHHEEPIPDMPAEMERAA
jgi:O-antigen/teichoic acid export membrane protein